MPYRAGLPWRFRNVFYGVRRAIFSLSETLVVTLLLYCLCRVAKLYIFFLEFQRGSRFFRGWGVIFWV